MIAHFRYLVFTEARNRLRRQALRVRNPRYALALILGLAYFWFAFGGSRAFGGNGTGPGAMLVGPLRALGPLLLAVYAGLTWIIGKSDALAFRPAEVHLLFPAPLTHRDLLRYKLLHAQVPLAFSSAFMTLVSHDAPLPWWLRLPSIWVLLSTLQLHHLAAALVHDSAAQDGLVGWRRNWLPIAVFGGAALALVLSLANAFGQVTTAADPRAALAALRDGLHGPIPTLVLAPFRFVLAPVVATPAEWPPAMAIALIVLLAHYVWVLRSNTAFEEAAAEAGERRARAVQALRGGGGWRSYARALRPAKSGAKAPPAAFRLTLRGRPEVALVWKNLTFARRGRSRASLMLSVGMAVVLVAMFASGEATLSEGIRQVGMMGLWFGVMMVIAGPVWVRNDLRLDLRHIDVLRTMPLPAPRLVGAEITASAITVAVIQLALLGSGALLIAISGTLPLPPAQFALACVAGLIAVPALATLGVTIQCALALTFPAWVHLGTERPGGVETMGQNILTLVSTVILLALLLIPPALVGLVGMAALRPQWGPLAPYLGAILGVVATYGEVWLAAQALGRLFERTDPGDLGLVH